MGSFVVAVGLAVFGLSTYVFTAVTARALGPEGFGTFSVFWSVVYGVGLGIALPVEQETSRRVAEARHRGQSVLVVVRQLLGPVAGLVGAGILIAVVVLVLVVDEAAELPLLVLAVMTAFVGLGAAHLTRGAFSGTGRFPRYSLQLIVEGIGRLALVAALVLAGASHPGPFAVSVGAALLLATAVSLYRVRARPEAGPQREVVKESTPANRPAVSTLLTITVATLTAQSLINFGPVVVRLLDPTASAAAGSFLAAALIARTPTFAFAAVQAVLIPRLVHALGNHDVRGYRRTLRTVLLAVAALSVVAVAVCAAAGPEILRLFAGPGFDLGRFDIVLLAVSTGLYLVTLTLQPAAIALRRHTLTAWVWLSAGAVFVLLCLVPGDPVRVTNLAMCGSLAAAVVGLWIVIRQGLATR
jgi:O-antigen/teichoic acid export membrane protein